MFTLSPFACHGLDYGGSFLCTWIIRVRDPVHSKAALLATGTPSFLYQSITVLDPSPPPRDLRPWSEELSTSVCMTNRSFWSGCRKTSHRLVETPTRYVAGHRPGLASVTTRDRSPFLERAQGRCLPSITTSTGTSPLLPAPL